MKELSLHILDIAQNSIRAGAKEITIAVKENLVDNLMTIDIIDDGKGMTSEMLEHIKNPYTTSRTMRNVGLGIPLFNDTCRLCKGTLEIESVVGEGTSLRAIMENDHIDKPPMGDIGGTISGIMSSEPDINFIFKYIKFRSNENEALELTTNMLKEELDGVSLQSLEVVSWIKAYINENIAAL